MAPAPLHTPRRSDNIRHLLMGLMGLIGQMIGVFPCIIYIIMYARARVHLYNMYDSPDEEVIRCIVHEVSGV